MMKTLLWVIVIGLIILVAKRFLGGLVGVVMFLVAIFFSIFMLDTFTVVDVRKYVDVGFYDETRENPKETVQNVASKVKDKGVAAVDKINDIGEKANDRYNTQSIVNIDDTYTEKEDAPIEEKKPDQVVEPVAEPTKQEDVKTNGVTKKLSSSPRGQVPEIDGYTYYPMTEQQRVVDNYKLTMSERDLSLLRSLSPFLTITYEGDAFRFHTEVGVKGLYIQKK